MRCCEIEPAESFLTVYALLFANQFLHFDVTHGSIHRA